MLLEKEYVNKPAPQEVWLDSLESNIVIESAPTTQIIRSRVRKLRRMQSQNFVQRAIYDVVSIFGRHRESA
ncbi:MAG: hypothetical protein U0103_24080 [Candidatus Obscuribacterales bacterium]